MDDYQREISLIKQILHENSKGMTVSDIARKISINRNSVAKYLDIMRISGQVEMITFGPAKVFFPARRIPILDLLNYTSDYIIVYDEDFKITMINDAFLKYFRLERSSVLGQSVIDKIKDFFKGEEKLLMGLKEAIRGRDFSYNLIITGIDNNLYFKIKVIPTTFEDGQYGATIILKNITDRKLAENALLKSQKNIKNLLKRINKK